MKTSVPLVPRVRMVALVLIHQQAVLLAIVLEPGILEPLVKLVNTVEQHISNLYNVLGTGFNIEFSFASRHVVIIVQMLDRL